MSKPHSVVFLGTSAFAVPSLTALLESPDARVDLVITQPDKPAGRSQKMTPPPVKILAQKHGIEVVQPASLNTEFDAIRKDHPTLTPDFLITVAYGQILSEEVLGWPSMAPLNVHGSLLPRWRGASPIQHALLAGDPETGVSIQKMIKELDAGPILKATSTPIAPRETWHTLHDRLSLLGADLLIEALGSPLHFVEQDAGKVTLCGKLTRQDGTADPATMTAEQVDRKVRALNPWPGVRLTVDGEELKILETDLVGAQHAVPLQTKHGTLHLVSVQPPGKKPMTGAAWARGRR